MAGAMYLTKMGPRVLNMDARFDLFVIRKDTHALPIR